jgi:hypothetical protein
MPATLNPIKANILTSGDVVIVNSEPFTSLTVEVTGTYTGANFTFEVAPAPEGPWAMVQVTRVDTGAGESVSGVIASTTRFWSVPVAAHKFFRLRNTALVSGTVAVLVQPSMSQAIPVASAAGGGGGAVTQSGTWTVGLNTSIPAGVNTIGNVGINGSVSVTGTFWQATQPVSIAATVTTAGQDNTASGSITTQNLVPAGVATPGSAVAISTTSLSTLGIQVTGVYTGALSVQATIDGSTWVTIGSIVNSGTNAVSATIPSASTAIYQVDVSGYSQARVTGLAAMTGTATVTLRASDSPTLVAIDAPLPAGANTIGSVRVTDGTTMAKVQPASTSPVTADAGLTVSLSPNLAATPYALSAAATTNATSVKASAGTLFSIICSNTAAATNYLKLYNKASAPTVGTDVPVLTIAIPTNGTIALELGTLGYRFAAGIAFATTVNAVDSDTTVLAAANTMKIALSYN